ncbi:hypothetical protein JWZ98_08950 [Methylomonas sp. EFPC1]|uniref:hypothetical protein n=1 Tax=Methylomonas sp. EFPC1 TaxID=2812647 RepID=UPI001967DB9A|nr:hypothetical protein [Methylomonas sp. EFPC1]QSB03035.1 hypothetical protein JWZ98_08950 [Methylomonas sp. EFPC1]
MAIADDNQDLSIVKPVEALVLGLMQSTELYLEMLATRKADKANVELGKTVRHIATCLSQHPECFEEFSITGDDSDVVASAFEDDDEA